MAHTHEMKFYIELGHVMAEAVNWWPLTAESWACARVSPCGICSAKSGTGTGFAPSTLVPCPSPHTHIIWGMNSSPTGGHISET
jgi:hypothetical protein